VSLARTRSVAAAIVLAACGGEPAPQVIAPTPLVADPTVAVIGTEARHVALLPASRPGGLRFAVTVPADPLLTFGFGLPEGEIAKVRTPGTFEFSIETEPEGRTVIGTQRVDPGILEDRRWFDARMDLGAWSGREIILGFRLRPDEGSPAPIGAIAHPTLLSRGHRDDRPNLVVVSLDTLRARNVGTYGYARETTPFLDRFAERGTLFETAITTSVTTGPSHMSIFTGLYPVNHGMRAGNEPKTDGVGTLPTYLRGVGFDTAAFTENGFIIRKFGFGQGFDKYSENRGSRRRAPGEARVTFPQAERWITERAREPFFAFIHTYEVHSPFRPPKPYADLFAKDDLPGPELSEMRLQRDNYDREIRFVDDELRRLVSTLEELGLLERTIVVILSDHGEEFHEHGRYQHGGAVFEETLRVPLIFVGPGIRSGQRIETQVSLIDVLPTVLDLIGVDRSNDVDGVSLVSALSDGAEPEARTLFAEANAPRRWLMPFQGESWNPPLIAVRGQGEKWIVHRPRQGEADPPKRFDLTTDALERSPLPVEGEALAAVETLVDEYLRGRGGAAVTQPVEPLDPDLRQRLELLGYLHEEETPTPGSR